MSNPLEIDFRGILCRWRAITQYLSVHSLFQSKDEPEGSEGVAKPGFVLSGFEFNSA
jgi:hypothetical protein